MRIVYSVILTLLLSGSVVSQEIIDNTGVNIDKNMLKPMIKEISKLFRDPASTQFRSLRYVDEFDVICGELNSKNGFGAYSGFVPFMYDPGDQYLTVLDPNAPNYVDIPAMFELANTVPNWYGCTDEIGRFIAR